MNVCRWQMNVKVHRHSWNFKFISDSPDTFASENNEKTNNINNKQKTKYYEKAIIKSIRNRSYVPSNIS